MQILEQVLRKSAPAVARYPAGVKADPAGGQPAAPPLAVPDRETYFACWSVLHGGLDPDGSRWILGWLSLTYRVARPLALRRIPPDALTATGPVLGGAVVGATLAGGRWPLLAMIVVVLSGLMDSLDGAVAALRGMARPWGTVLDSLADRCTDLLYLIALWVSGAPGWLCVAAGGLTLLQESSRATAAAAGMVGVGVITVWERPSRIILLAFAMAAVGAAPGWAGEIATVAAAVACGLAVAGCIQLLRAAYLRLR